MSEHYTVDWTIEVGADSHRDAALRARSMQLRPTTATTFHVCAPGQTYPTEVDVLSDETAAHPPLNIETAIALGTILGWAQRWARLRWLHENGDLLEGTARSVGDIDGNFAQADDDVRDCFLRITTTSGFECFMPMSRVLELFRSGSIGED